MRSDTKHCIQFWSLFILMGCFCTWFHNINLTGDPFIDIIVSFVPSIILILGPIYLFDVFNNYIKEEDINTITFICWFSQVITFFLVMISAFFVFSCFVNSEIKVWALTLLIGGIIGKIISSFVRKIFFPTVNRLRF
ncbi:hypothetical protein KJ603_01410 [Patescibacteria group bacterium]|nr:hypothetical protein [Patescibacteria group bacterium]